MAKDARLRTPVDDAYLISLGRALYAFACLEWNALCCCDRMKPGYVHKADKVTAKGLAKDVAKYAGRLAEENVRLACVAAAEEFGRLADLRNDIYHSHPATLSDGSQRLLRRQRALTIEEIDDAADAFTECSMTLNVLLHGPLREVLELSPSAQEPT
ncbi:hypothetical protein [Methylobacterium sp. CCH5-D2]|uniref:hypothetical protein n=1 Tax=Methylobacterium sp. CCH5-D2 TaxID=1768765 RepID=UPI000AF06F7B|nr:hypothetical protein [Methylobacterium sp. CCH5-D2]